MVVLLCGAMDASRPADTTEGAWPLAAARIGTPLRNRRDFRTRRDEANANSTGVAITSSLFLLLLAAALLIGGHAAIDPLLRSAFAARAANGVSDVVFAMPDGIYCRHMSFDNATGELTERALERCSGAIADSQATVPSKFSWDVR